jgi:ABC-type nitrate/sulfonate/bicarbonate transport system permease component
MMVERRSLIPGIPGPRFAGTVSGLVFAVGERLLPFVVVAVTWELVVRLGVRSPQFFPSLRTVGQTLWRLLASGVLLAHMYGTITRLACGFLLAAVVGVLVGIIMGRSIVAEEILGPLVSLGSPIPGLAYAPLFVLWFGFGDLPAVLLVGVAAAFPVAVNTWTGAKTVKEIWIRAARVMGAAEHQVFRQIVLPGALPHVLVGLRLGLARAWRVLVAVEVLTAVPRGLGWLIFGAREFLQADVMLAGIAMIGLVGFLLDRVVFAYLERLTVVRWGMLG